MYKLDWLYGPNESLLLFHLVSKSTVIKYSLQHFILDIDLVNSSSFGQLSKFKIFQVLIIVYKVLV